VEKHRISPLPITDESFHLNENGRPTPFALLAQLSLSLSIFRQQTKPAGEREEETAKRNFKKKQAN